MNQKSSLVVFQTSDKVDLIEKSKYFSDKFRILFNQQQNMREEMKIELQKE
jgi:hypothetical protein